jgi:hypothetical protein
MDVRRPLSRTARMFRTGLTDPGPRETPDPGAPHALMVSERNDEARRSGRSGDSRAVGLADEAVVDHRGHDATDDRTDQVEPPVGEGASVAAVATPVPANTRTAVPINSAAPAAAMFVPTELP